MLTISKALSAGQARTYHAHEFVSEKQNYWTFGVGYQVAVTDKPLMRDNVVFSGRIPF